MRSRDVPNSSTSEPDACINGVWNKASIAIRVRPLEIRKGRDWIGRVEGDVEGSRETANLYLQIELRNEGTQGGHQLPPGSLHIVIDARALHDREGMNDGSAGQHIGVEGTGVVRAVGEEGHESGAAHED